MVLSKKQEDAIEWIKRMEKFFGNRWFIRCEILNRISWVEMRELVLKRYVEEQEFEGMTYYRFRGGI